MICCDEIGSMNWALGWSRIGSGQLQTRLRAFVAHLRVTFASQRSYLHVLYALVLETAGMAVSERSRS